MSVISGQVLLFHLSAIWWCVAGGPHQKAGAAAWGWSCVCHSFSRCFKMMCCKGDELNTWSKDTDHQQWCLWLRSSSSAEIYMVQMKPVKPVFHLLWLPGWIWIRLWPSEWRRKCLIPLVSVCGVQQEDVAVMDIIVCNCVDCESIEFFHACIQSIKDGCHIIWCCKHIAFIFFNFLCQCNSVCSSLKPL